MEVNFDICLVERPYILSNVLKIQTKEFEIAFENQNWTYLLFCTLKRREKLILRSFFMKGGLSGQFLINVKGLNTYST